MNRKRPTLFRGRHFQDEIFLCVRWPRVINVDGHPAYATAISELKQAGELGSRCRCRPSPYLNHVLEQDHRFIKKRMARVIIICLENNMTRVQVNENEGAPARFLAHAASSAR